MNMKMFCWNIRELNNPSRQRFIRSWVGVNKHLSSSVLETHVSEDNATTIFTLPFLVGIGKITTMRAKEAAFG